MLNISINHTLQLGRCVSWWSREHFRIQVLDIKEIISVRLTCLHLFNSEGRSCGKDVASWLPKHKLRDLGNALLVRLRQGSHSSWDARTIPAGAPSTQCQPYWRSTRSRRHTLLPSSTQRAWRGFPRNWQSAKRSNESCYSKGAVPI